MLLSLNKSKLTYNNLYRFCSSILTWDIDTREFEVSFIID